jgi:hypothetical protein
MSGKHPYVSNTTISRWDGRRDNEIKDVEMELYTSYKSDDAHTIHFDVENGQVVLQRHAKDYGSRLPAEMEKRVNDAETARNLAWERLEELNLDEVERWSDE